MSLMGMSTLEYNRLLILEDIKLLLGIENADSDTLLEVYIKRAVYVIRNYLNKDDITDEEIELLHGEAVVSIVVNAQMSITSESKGIKSITQGARSITYSDNASFTVTNDVKSILPLPYVRMR